MSRQQRSLAQYTKWFTNRTPAEKALQRLAFSFEEKYFSDLRLRAPSIKRRLLQYEVRTNAGTSIETEDADISLHAWAFKLRRSSLWAGLCACNSRTIYVKPDLPEKDHRATLLHEMIHAYEHELSPAVREWLLLDFYRKMQRRIGQRSLHRLMDISTHMTVHNSIHGLLFLMKSLDIDLRMKWPRGTVFGYGRDDFFG